MKIKTNRQDLLKLLSRIAPVADPKSTMPILANVLLRADPDKLNGCLTVAATNLQIAMRADVSVSVEEAGAICLPARDLLDRVKVMPEGELKLETKGTQVIIKAKASARRFTLHGIPADEFPSLPELKSVQSSHETTAIELSEVLALTTFSVSDDLSRQHLNSLLLTVGSNSIRAVSTDGHRLSMFLLGDEGDGHGHSWLVPKASIQRVKSLIDDSPKNTEKPEIVRLAQSGPDLFATCGDFTMSLKLADAQFPPWKQVIPEKSNHIATVNRINMIDAIKALMVTASDTSGGVEFTFVPGKLKLKSESADKGEGVDELECEYSGTTASYGLSGRYMLDVLAVIYSEQVTLGLGEPLDPVRIEPAQKSAGREHIAIVMPMRI